MKTHRWLITAVGAVSTVACQPAAVQPAVQPLTRTASADTTLYPLETGRSWTYQLAQYKDGQATGKTDSMASTVVAVTDTATGRVAKVDRTYGTMTLPATQASLSRTGVVLARWPESTPPGASRLSGRLLPLPDGVRQTRTTPSLTDDEVTTSLQILSLPPQAGQSWTGRVWTFAKETLTAQGWEPITVPAGSYKAWHVVHRIAYDDGRLDNLGYWYAPGVGMIKAHEESTLVMGGQPTRYSVDGALTDRTNAR